MYCITDDYDKARQKLKVAEVTSDLNSDIEESNMRRKINKPRRVLESSEEEGEEPKSKFERPPKVIFSTKHLG